jgi:exopolysaccharide biosynthesis predicted pyruvyltransferase EpsI
MNVRELFERYRGMNVHLLPNEGNCGDGLIAMGLRELCSEHGVGVTELLHPRPARGHALFVLGCGNLCGPFHFQVTKIQNYLGHFEKIHLLPCSIDPASEEVASFLGSLPPGVTIFCRERFSFEKVTALAGGRNPIYMDHDLAFAVDYRRWQRAGSGRLNAFRTDRESLGHALPPDNIDVSIWGGSADGKLMIRMISEYRSVHTDRAHVAICAAMLGKETHVYPNNYHKVRGIFEYSLCGRPGVFFHENFPGGGGDAPGGSGIPMRDGKTDASIASLF